MFCPPLTNAVFPTTFDSFHGRTGEMPIRVKMAWGGVKSPVEDRHGGRSNCGVVERPRPAPSPEVSARHRLAKMARPVRSVRSTNSTFYSPRTKLVFLKDVSAVHYQQDSTKPRFLFAVFFFFLFFFFFSSTDLYIYILDTVPPIHSLWNHLDTDMLTTANGGTFTSSSASLSSQSR